MSQLEYTIRERSGFFEVAGPALSKSSVRKTEREAISLARHLIGGRSGFITRTDASGHSDREAFQGSRHLVQFAR